MELVEVKFALTTMQLIDGFGPLRRHFIDVGVSLRQSEKLRVTEAAVFRCHRLLVGVIGTAA